MESTWQNGPALALNSFAADAARLQTHSVSDLWRLWWRVGAALAVASSLKLQRWIALERQRNELKELDARLLRDIGVTAEQARKEALKLFWME